MIISFEEPPNRKYFESEREYRKALKEWKTVYDSIMQRYGIFSSN